MIVVLFLFKGNLKFLKSKLISVIFSFKNVLINDNIFKNTSLFGDKITNYLNYFAKVHKISFYLNREKHSFM